MESYKVELEHIRIELMHRRQNVSHLRHFVDQWFCYKHGHITKGNKATWGKIVFNEYVSEGVLELLEKYTETDLLNMKGKNKLIVEKEHIIPLYQISKKLLRLPANPSIEQIEAILEDTVKYATITKKEDKILLKKDMPSEYFDSTHELFNDSFARYKSAGIKINKK
jgi:hypothetical protein